MPSGKSSSKRPHGVPSPKQESISQASQSLLGAESVGQEKASVWQVVSDETWKQLRFSSCKIWRLNGDTSQSRVG